MQVTYDSLSRLETPKFYVCSPGSIYSNNTVSNSSGIITDKSDEEITINFNDLSQLEFRAYKIDHDDPDINDNAHQIYDSLKNRRMIFVDGIGYFVITNVTESHTEEGIRCKDITAQSAELEIQNKMLSYIEDGTYRFSSDANNIGLFDRIIETLPLWSVGSVDQGVASRWRTFEDVDTDTNVFGFMIEQMEEAYECIFEFDTINRLIYVYDQNSYSVPTSIHLTKDDLIKSIEIQESSDDLYTALRVYGDEEDVNISAINPIGNSVIYNFDYYLSWMSNGLRAKVTEWQNIIRGVMDNGISIHLEDVQPAQEGSLSSYVKMRVDTSAGSQYPAPSAEEVSYLSTPGNTIYIGSKSYSIVSYNSSTYTITINTPVVLGNGVGIIFIDDAMPASSSYYERSIDYYNKLANNYNYRANMDIYDTQRTMYQRCRENTVASSSDDCVAKYNEIISKYGGSVVRVFDWESVNGTYELLSEKPEDFDTNYTNYFKIVGGAYVRLTSHEEWGTTDYYKQFMFQVGDFAYDTIQPQTVGQQAQSYFCICGIAHVPDNTKRLDNVTYWERQTINTTIKDKNPNEQIAYTIMALDTFIEQASNNYDANTELDTSTRNELDAIKGNLNAVHELVDINNFFTQAEYDELYNYIYEGSYNDEYVTITESMNYAQKFSQMKILYDRAVAQLNKISTPNQSFTVNVNDFIFSKDFDAWARELKVGCAINVEVAPGDVAKLFLSNLDLCYGDRYLEMTFGNRIDKKGIKSMFQDLFGNIQKSQNTLSYVRDIITPVKNGEINKVKEALQTSRDLTKDRVMSSNNEQVTIDDNGYTGRRMLSDDSVSPTQIKISADNIVFTDDSWDSCKTAIGKIDTGDGAYTYGVNAQTLIGDIIVGNEIHILDNNGNDAFSVIDDKIAASAQSVTFDIRNNVDGILDNTVNGLISTSINQDGQVWNFVTNEINPITQQLATNNKYIRFNGGIILGDSSSVSSSTANSKLRLVNDIIVFFDGDEDITRDDVLFRAMDPTYESYMLLTSKPSDWDTNASKYYRYDSTDAKYVAVNSGTTWAYNSYYRKKEYSVYSYFSTDSFYDDNLIAGSSIQFGSNDGYVRVKQSSSAPAFATNTYYKKSPNASLGVFEYTLLSSAPSNWSTTYYNYYKRTKNFKFIKGSNGHLTLEMT